MEIKANSNWPLMVTIPPKKSSIQKIPAANLPLQNPRDPVMQDDTMELETNIRWEKGTFIDLYI